MENGMSGKIFIASSSATIVPNAHTYLIYDADGDTDTFNDQYIINAGPSGADNYSLWGHINIQSNLSVQDSIYYKLDMNDDGIIDRDAEDYYNYTELQWAAPISATDMWTFMTSVADDIIGADEITYYPWGPNSNSITNTILSASGIDFRVNTPKDSGVGDRFSPTHYIGHIGLIDSSGSA
jgi:hypothetical protein